MKTKIYILSVSLFAFTSSLIAIDNRPTDNFTAMGRTANWSQWNTMAIANSFGMYPTSMVTYKTGGTYVTVVKARRVLHTIPPANHESGKPRVINKKKNNEN